MSILIKGMGMPKNCLECVFYRRTDPVYDYCCISSATPKGYVPNDCPLVFVPPHGRLIDADALDDAFTELRWDDEGLAHWGDRNEWCLSGNEVEELFNNAPTVIPADKDGES